MPIFLDITVVGLIVMFAFIGAKRGFIKEILSLLGTIIALVLAVYLSGLFSDLIFDKFVGPSVHNKVYEGILAKSDNTVSSVTENLPEYIKNFSGSFDVDINETVKDGMSSSIEKTADSVADSVTKTVARPLIVNIITVIMFIILFILIKLLIRLLAKALNLIAKLPVLHAANKIFGFIFGGLKGIVIVYAMCFVLTLIVGFTINGFLGINQSVLEKTVVFSWFKGIFNI